MARKKKSRKIGLIGTRKSPDFKRVEKEKRVKKTLGKPAGSRNSPIENTANAGKAKANNDPRLGSKKPINLYASVDDSLKIKTNKVVVKHFSPESELAQIESDEKLAQLIAISDEGGTLDSGDQKYLNKQLKRHKALCDLLGIAEESEIDTSEENVQSESDLYEQFERIDVNKLNNF